MTPKEALQVLIDNLEYPCNEEYDIVWNTLNRLEELEKTNIVLTNQVEHERKIRIRQEKKLKAFEIIANKCCIELEHKVVNIGVDVYWMVLNGVLTIELYKEEFDLLKEYLK